MDEKIKSLKNLSDQHRALFALQRMRSRLDELEGASCEPIAVVGMSCRFPGGANTPEDFWSLLRSGVDAVTIVPPDRWNAEEFYDPDPQTPGKMYLRSGAFLDEVDKFDADFFGIPPREAMSMDPQHRLLLEVSWEALERACLPPRELKNCAVGVFAGIMIVDYLELLRDRRDQGDIDVYVGTGVESSFLSGRLSHFLGLQGPSMTIATACSSSLVAVHLACQSLRARECELALAGGVNLMLAPDPFLALCRMHAVAADGRCKTFDAAADGYGRGEGCGIVVLKRLSDALRDKDSIAAIIRGSAINHDGPSSGLTVPNVAAQERLLRAALANAKVAPNEVSYIEAHGTGTLLGDPIEIRALSAVLGEGRSADERLRLGSVKTNIGHLEGAAGIAGLIKLILSVQHKEIPPHLHLKQLNPLIPVDVCPIEIPVGCSPWPTNRERCIGGVSSFGLSGANAHVIVEEAPEPAKLAQTSARPRHVLCMSAKSEARLQELVARFELCLARITDDQLADVCFSASAGRSHFEHRLAVTCSSVEEAAQALAAFRRSADSPVHRGDGSAADPPGVAFFFPGDGTIAAAGAQLYQSESAFRRAMERCDDVLREYLDEPLLNVLYADDEAMSPLLQQVRYAHCALFALEYSLSELWMAWGIEPAAVFGCGVGEVAAACAAGVFDLSDALILTLARALAIEQSAQPPASDPSLERLEQQASQIAYRPARIPLVSSRTGKVADGAETSRAAYWRRPMQEAVQLRRGMETLVESGAEIVLSIGPWPDAEIGAGGFPDGLVAQLSSLLLNRDDWEVLLNSLAELYVRGVQVDWMGFDRDYPRRKLVLPTYPFERQRLWLDQLPVRTAPPAIPATDSRDDEDTLLGRRLYSSVLSNQIVFETIISEERFPALEDHKVFGRTLVPAAYFVSAAMEAARVLGVELPVLEDVVFARPLVLSGGRKHVVQVVLTQDDAGTLTSFEALSRVESSDNGEPTWRQHAFGKLSTEPDTATRPRLDVAAVQDRCTRQVMDAEFYQALRSRELDLGPSFQWIERVWWVDGEALCRLRNYKADIELSQRTAGVIDAGFQSLAACALGSDDDGAFYAPFHIARISCESPVVSPPSWSHAAALNDSDSSQETLRGNVRLYNTENELLLELRDVRLKRTTREVLSDDEEEEAKDWLYRIRWQGVSAPPRSLEEVGNWLIFAHPVGTGKTLAELLKQNGHRCVVIAPGETAKNLGNGRYTLDPARIGELRHLMPDLLPGDSGEFQGVLHLWGLSELDGQSSTDATLDSAQELGCRSALQLVQVLLHSTTSHPPRLWLVTRGCQSISGEDVAAAQAPLWGLGRSIAMEHPELRCTMVDLDPARPAGEVECLMRELGASDKENQIAIRGNHRYAPRLTPFQLNSAAGQSAGQLRPPSSCMIRNDASYLISGGLGAIGTRLARWLLDEGAGRVVLMSRRMDAARKERVTQELNSPEGLVHFLQGDVSRQDDVARVLETIGRESPPLRGIFHLAGVLDDGMLIHQDWLRFQNVMASKARGAWNLHRQTLDFDLDLFVLFSSVSSLLGTPGQANYAAANSFLDALAWHRRANQLPALTINWGPWSNSVLDAERESSLPARWTALGVSSLSNDQGLRILHRLLQEDAAHVTVVRLDRRKLNVGFAYPGASLPPILSELQAHGSHKPTTWTLKQLRQRLEEAPPAQRWEVLLDQVRREVAEAFGYADIQRMETDRGFFDMGMDSLLAIELRNRLQARLGRPIPATLVFDYPTIESLAGYIASDMLGMTLPAQHAAQHQTAPVTVSSGSDEPIAIIGQSCRFPGEAVNPESYWQLLHSGADAIQPIPPDRWDVEAYYDSNPNASGKMYTRYGGFLKEIDRFDAEFFRITDREARSMDPQQRLFLEVSWEALETAAYPPSQLADSRTGVFLGISANDYLQARLLRDDPAMIDAYLGTGNALSAAAGRLSNFLGLRGPSLAIDTSCSSSLVAVHMACQSLRSGECDMALAGGVNLMLSPETFINLCKARMAAADGRCKTFDARADGYGRGEGCGVVVLKRLADAVAQRDHVLAVILGSTVNQDGAASGLTVPSGTSQEILLREALRRAKVEPEDVDYVEAHGTGTPLGDPIEVRALSSVFGPERSRRRPLVIGSVKTNIGHLEAAAGVASLIKVILALQHEVIPPHLHMQTVNPELPLQSFPVVIPTQPMPWPVSDRKRIAGISSFGFIGTNAHVVVAEASRPAAAPTALERPLHLLTLSAKTGEALRELALRFAERLRDNQHLSLADVCHTANTGRAFFKHRLALVADSVENVAERLADGASGKEAPGYWHGVAKSVPAPAVAFLFTGQGSSYVQMGRELYETHPSFRQTLERCEKLLHESLERPLLSVLYPPSSHSTEAAEAESLLSQAAYAQPALFVLQYALYELFDSWGVRPAAVAGHSVGEYMAACAAGIFSMEDCLKLVAQRGRLMQELPPGGAMAAIFASEAQVRSALSRHAADLSVAAVNAPQQVVVSGPAASVALLLRQMESEGIVCRRLNVSHAFHSSMVEPVQARFEKAAAMATYQMPQIRLISNVTGDFVSGGAMSQPEYWSTHLRQPVMFCAGMQRLAAEGFDLFLELGPNPTLLAMGRTCVPGGFGGWLPSLQKGKSDWEQLLKSLATLYTRGVNPDWRGFDQGYTRSKVLLPTYPFQRRRYWVETQPKRAASTNGELKEIAHGLLGRRLSSPALRDCTVFQVSFGADRPPSMQEHKAFDRVVVPGAVFIAMALSAAHKLFGPAACALEEVVFSQPLILNEGELRHVQFVVDRRGVNGAALFEALSRAADAPDDAEWIRHASGKLYGDVQKPAADEFDAAGVQARCSEQLAGSALYQMLSVVRLELGPSFRWIQRVWRRSGEALSELRDATPEATPEERHVGRIDACFQSMGGALAASPERIAFYAPFHIKYAYFAAEIDKPRWCHSKLHSVTDSPGSALTGAVTVYDDKGRLLSQMQGVDLVRASADTLLRPAETALEEWLYEVQWKAKESSIAAPVDFIPSCSLLAQELTPNLAQLCQRQDVIQGRHLAIAMQRLCSFYVADALAQCGWNLHSAQTQQAADLADRLGVAAKYRRLLERLLDFLQEDGVLQKTEGQWTVERLPEVFDAAQFQQELVALAPDWEAELKLLHDCGTQLAYILTGERDPLQLLFPKGSLATAERLYQHSPVHRVCNLLIQQTLSRFATECPENQVLRVLEIGAGTGGLTSYALLALDAQRCEYVFSDVSAAFIAKARVKFEPYPFVKYELLDIEQDPLKQGFVAHQFDVILAGNVLHATSDLRKTMRNVVRLLAPEGLLIMLETINPQRWLDLTFGLTDGWWKFTDTELRPRYPLLSPQGWLELLTGLGFDDAVSLPGAELDELDLLQHAIILSRGPTAEKQRELFHPSEESSDSFCLIFADRGGVGEQIAQTLSLDRQQCILVRAGMEFDRSGLNFTINPDCDEHYQRLFGALPFESYRVLSEVVHLWALDANIGDEAPVGEAKSAQSYGCRSVLSLAQQLPGCSSKQPPRLWIVTQDAQRVAAEDRLQGVVQSTLWGLGRVLGNEHPEFAPALVDLESSESIEQKADHVVASIHAVDGEDQVAFRKGVRHVARLVHAAEPISGAADPSSPAGARSNRRASYPLKISSDGSYLITGGFGALGMHFAEWLAERGARHLALLGRNDATSSVREIIARLQANGVQAAAFRGDVCDPVRVAQVLEEIKSQMPPLRGIVHAAGVVDHGWLADQSWERFATLMAPKLGGVWVLHQLTRGWNLDWFTLFSTAHTLIGTPGQSNHAAANAFLDAFAQYRCASGLPTVSISWAAWSQIGSAEARSYGDRLPARGVGVISPPQGVALFEKVHEGGYAHVAVLPIQWQEFGRQFSASRIPPMFSELASHKRKTALSAAPPGELMERLKSASPSERKAILFDGIQHIVGAVLGVRDLERLDPQQGLFESGMDSLMALELKNALQHALAHPLPATLVMEQPTIDSLVEFFARELFSDAAAITVDRDDAQNDAASVDLDRIQNLSDRETEERIDHLIDLLVDDGSI